MATMADRRMAGERRFYSAMSYMMIVLVLIGFAPSFYLRGIVHYPRPNPTLNPLVVLHGLMFTLWLGVFWAQTALVAAGQRETHKRLGVAGMILALLLIPLMYATAVAEVARANEPPFATPLGWTAVPVGTLIAFTPLVWLGWTHRRNAQAHKRLMLSAALLFMAPALGRFPIAPPVLVGHAVQQALAWCTFLPLMWWDRRTLGQLHWATKLGAGLAAFGTMFGTVMCVSPAWEAVAAHLPGV